MTVLSDVDIERSISRGEIGAEIGGGRPLHIEPASMDVHLSESIKIEAKSSGPVDVTDKSTYPDYYERSIEGGYPLLSGKFALGSTEETLEIPTDTIGFLHGRSSVGRLGLFIENAGLIDPGFKGDITLELYNASRNPIEIHPGMRIGQITFHDMRTEPSVGYSKENGNKYNGQTNATPSRLYEDFQ